MATVQERKDQIVKALTRKTKAELVELIVDEEAEVVDEPEVTPEPEVVEDETATGETNVALVTEKATGKTFEAERIVTREPEVLEDGTVTDGTIKTVVFTVNDEVLSESEFYRRFTPLNHIEAKKLRQEE